MERVGGWAWRCGPEEQPRHVLFSHTRVTHCFYTTFHGGRVFRYTLISHERAIRIEDQPRGTLNVPQGGSPLEAHMLVCDQGPISNGCRINNIMLGGDYGGGFG